MNNVINKFLLAEIHLTQLGFRYNACGSFTKNKTRIKKIKETRDTRYIGLIDCE